MKLRYNFVKDIDRTIYELAVRRTLTNEAANKVMKGDDTH